MKSGPMSLDSATRYVNRLIETMSYAAEAGVIKSNPLSGLNLPRGKTKEVYFLEPQHLERFWRLDLPGTAGVACWWMGVIFLTGLDYPDAVRYVENRSKYERETPWGKQIIIRRNKPPHAECYIPVSSQLEVLLQKRPAAKIPSDDTINEEMKAVERKIGFSHRLTCKIGRKTAGAIFFDEYENIGAVSRMLGHSSILITERYYVKTTGRTVDKVMQQRQIQRSTQDSFLKVD